MFIYKNDFIQQCCGLQKRILVSLHIRSMWETIYDAKAS